MIRNSVDKKTGEVKEIKFNMKYSVYARGTYMKKSKINYGDKIIRNGSLIDPSLYSDFVLCDNDVILTENNEKIPVVLPQKTTFILNYGDIVERQLKNGDK